jgi:hypothetical protein
MTTPQTTICLFSPEILGHTVPTEAVRGVGWVMRWAAAIAMLGVAGIVLLDFAYRVAGEQALVRAAKAGVRETAMPRATSRSVEQSICRALGELPPGCRSLRIVMTSGGKPWRGGRTADSAAAIVITLSLPVAEVIPDWLRVISPATGGVMTVHNNPS